MRHLPATDIQSTLRRGKSVEQFMGRSPANPNYIRHIELRPSSDLVEVWVYDVEDQGSEEWLDLYDFNELEKGEADLPAAAFEDADAAIAHAQEALSANPSRWVNLGIAQSEYLDYIRSGRPNGWPAAA